MVKKIFSHWSALFLPLGLETKLTRAWTAHGGELEYNIVADQIDFIFANRWDDVVQHFNPFPGLMEYFVEKEVWLVDLEWVAESVRLNEDQKVTGFWLHPDEPARILDEPWSPPNDPPTLPKCTLSPDELSSHLAGYKIHCDELWVAQKNREGEEICRKALDKKLKADQTRKRKKCEESATYDQDLEQWEKDQDWFSQIGTP